MSRAREVTLYTRPDCHLCELAERMLENCGVAWQAVDIEGNLELVRRYGTRIPVAYRADVDRELAWPFTEDGLAAFIDLEI